MFGSSAPFLFITEEGDKQLYVGCEDGTFYLYTPTPDLTGAFTEVTTNFSGLDDGNYSSLCIADIDNDSYPDFVTGNLRGGITFYRNTLSTPVFNTPVVNNQVQLSPNPVTSNLNITALDNWLFNKITVFSLDGKLWQTNSFGLTDNYQICLSELPSGFYIVTIYDNAGNNQVKTFIKH